MKEYLKRDLVVAKAYGVREGLHAISYRMGQRQDCPAWLLEIVDNEYNKMEAIISTLIEHREEIEHD